MGRSANGLLEWKDSSGRILRDIEEQEITTANEEMYGGHCLELADRGQAFCPLFIVANFNTSII